MWLVDLKRQTLEVLVLRESNLATQATYHARERVRAEPFAAVEIELAFLWGERPESSNSSGPRLWPSQTSGARGARSLAVPDRYNSAWAVERTFLNVRAPGSHD